MIGHTEYSTTDIMFQDERGRAVDMGLAFDNWLDALTQRNAANIVELKYLILNLEWKKCALSPWRL